LTLYRGTALNMACMTDKITTADQDNRTATACQEPWVGAVRYRFGRAIGPWGTAARTVAAAGSFAWALAVPHNHPLGHLPGTSVLWWNVVLGLLIVPGVATVALRVRGRDAAPLMAGHASQCLAVIAFFALAQVLPVAMLLALGSSFVVQVLRGDGGCEFLAIPNWLLRRNDRLFCLLFTPIDAFEARARREA
jgi:hypothetical protein